MDIELVPDPGADDPAAQAAVAALVQEGLADNMLPAGSAGAWRRAGLEDAIDRSLTPGRSVATDSAAACPSGSGASEPADPARVRPRSTGSR